MIEATAIAHAKVNLALRVLAREATGYHGIETVFCRIALGDAVRVRAEVNGRSLDLGGPELPAGGLGPTERNLAWRAALAYADATGWPRGFAIEIVKRVPAAGGLGGGSADAGAVLRCLDALAPRPIGEARLVGIGTALGADVPFLSSERTHVLAWSRGERMLALPPLPRRDVALVIPPFGSPTQEAYERMTSARGPWSPVAGLAADGVGGWTQAESDAHNDFEDVVGAWHPEIHGCIGWLRDRGARIAMLAGSGSSIFGIFAEGGAPPEDARPPLGRLLLTHTLPRVVPVQRIG